MTCRLVAPLVWVWVGSTAQFSSPDLWSTQHVTVDPQPPLLTWTYCIHAPPRPSVLLPTHLGSIHGRHADVLLCLLRVYVLNTVAMPTVSPGRPALSSTPHSQYEILWFDSAFAPIPFSSCVVGTSSMPTGWSVLPYTSYDKQITCPFLFLPLQISPHLPTGWINNM